MTDLIDIDAFVRARDYQTAIHEAGHAVVAHLVGVAIDHVMINSRGGHSMPVSEPWFVNARKLRAEITAIRRRLLRDYVGGKWDGRKWVGGKEVNVLRKGGKRLKNGKLRGTPAPELVAHMERLTKRHNAISKRAWASLSKDDHIKDLMHTLGGPVADQVFFNVPFEAPRWRKIKGRAKNWVLARGCIRASTDARRQ
jgi:hypothetical protein